MVHLRGEGNECAENRFPQCTFFQDAAPTAPTGNMDQKLWHQRSQTSQEPQCLQRGVQSGALVWPIHGIPSQLPPTALREATFKDPKSPQEGRRRTHVIM